MQHYHEHSGRHGTSRLTGPSGVRRFNKDPHTNAPQSTDGLGRKQKEPATHLLLREVLQHRRMPTAYRDRPHVRSVTYGLRLNFSSRHRRRVEGLSVDSAIELCFLAQFPHLRAPSLCPRRGGETIRNSKKRETASTSIICHFSQHDRSVLDALVLASGAQLVLQRKPSVKQAPHVLQDWFCLRTAVNCKCVALRSDMCACVCVVFGLSVCVGFGLFVCVVWAVRLRCSVCSSALLGLFVCVWSFGAVV